MTKRCKTRAFHRPPQSSAAAAVFRRLDDADTRTRRQRMCVYEFVAHLSVAQLSWQQTSCVNIGTTHVSVAHASLTQHLRPSRL